MKQVLLGWLLVGLISLAGCQQDRKQKAAGASEKQKPATEQTKTAQSTTEISFEATRHDFGTIQAGEVVSHRFTFTNTGQVNLIVKKALASCGCTVPEYTSYPIKPGETGEVELTFNTMGFTGNQFKTVRVYANIEEGYKELVVTAFVDPPELKRTSQLK